MKTKTQVHCYPPHVSKAVHTHTLEPDEELIWENGSIAAKIEGTKPSRFRMKWFGHYLITGPNFT